MLTRELLERALHHEPEPAGKPFLIVPARLVEAARAFWGSAVDIYEAPSFVVASAKRECGKTPG
jgi:hypothetical protein